MARLLRARVRSALLDLPPQAPTLGRFAVLGVLGRGAQGTVLSAFDPLLDRKVAIKVLHAADLDTRARALREARALARVTHPNVVAVHEAAEADGDVFLVMQLVDGVALHRWLRAERRAVDTVLDALSAVAEGLAAAHAAGVIHGDVKPDNVLVGEGGHAWLADLGTARILGEGDGRAGGTPEYFAPERRAGAPPSASADQYALAVTLHEAITGARPEIDRDGRERRAVPRRLRPVLRRALASDPTERFSDVQALAAAIKRARARTRLRLVFGAAAIVAIGLTTRAIAPSPSLCHRAADGIATVWNDDRRAAVLSAAAEVNPTPHFAALASLTAAIDRRADDHAALAREVCEATRVRAEQSDTRYDARMGCLQRRQEELAAFTDTLTRSRSPSAFVAARDGIDALPSLERCSRADIDEAALGPGELTSTISDARRELDRGWAAFHLAQYREARAIATQVEAIAAATQHSPLVLETLLFVGATEGRDGDAARSERALAQAIMLASELHRDVDVAEAAMALLRARMFAGRLEAVESAADFARAALVRVDRAVAEVDGVVGEARLHAGDAAGALAPIGAALAVERDPARSALLHTLLGSAELQLGHSDRALAYYEKALATAVAHYGDDHPSVAFFLQRLGRGQTASGSIDAALTTLGQALALREASLGPNDRAVASALVDLAAAEAAVARLQTARDHLDRALAIRKNAYGPEHPQLSEPHQRLAEVLRRLGQTAEAREHFEAALAIRSRHTPEHPEVARIRTALAALGDATTP